MKIFKPLILLLITVSQTSLMAQIKSTDQTIEKIIAKVDHEIVLMSELETAYIQYRQSGNMVTPDLKCNVLETLIILNIEEMVVNRRFLKR